MQTPSAGLPLDGFARACSIERRIGFALSDRHSREHCLEHESDITDDLMVRDIGVRLHPGPARERPRTDRHEPCPAFTRARLPRLEVGRPERESGISNIEADDQIGDVECRVEACVRGMPMTVRNVPTVEVDHDRPDPTGEHRDRMLRGLVEWSVDDQQRTNRRLQQSNQLVDAPRVRRHAGPLRADLGP